MGKIKTRKTLQKRIRVTKTGKVLKNQTHMGHLKVKLSVDKKHRKSGLEEQPNIGHIKMFKKLLGK